jgi:hypothetical protein
MSTSTVNTGLDQITVTLNSVAQRVAQIKTELEQISADLGSIPSTHSTIISEIGVYAPDGADESLAKDRASKLQEEWESVILRVDNAAAEL